MLPTQEQIHALIKTGDIFKYAVVGFSAIEAAIDELVTESFHTSHRVELNRLSTELKVDLLIALGTLRKESKGLLVKLSRARNFYAHEFAGDAEYCPHQELISCFGKHHREMAHEHLGNIQTFRDALKVSFIAAYYDVVGGIERLKDFKKQRAEHLLHVEALLAVTENPVSVDVPADVAKKAKDELDEAIEAKRRELDKKREYLRGAS